MLSAVRARHKRALTTKFFTIVKPKILAGEYAGGESFRFLLSGSHCIFNCFGACQHILEVRYEDLSEFVTVVHEIAQRFGYGNRNFLIKAIRPGQGVAAF